MIWIFLLYVLPLITTVVGAYCTIKKDTDGSVKDFIQISLILLIPGLNLIIMIAGIYGIIINWIENSKDWQNFLNKKL